MTVTVPSEVVPAQAALELVGDRPKRLRSGERRRLLLDAARALVLEAGAENVTMERLAMAGGVSKALVYAHFSNHEEVLVALLEDEWARLDQQVRERMGQATDFDGLLRANMAPYFELALDPASVFKALVLELSSRPAVRSRQLERRAEVLRFWAGQVESSFGLARPAADLVASFMAGGFDAAVGFCLASGAMAPDEVLDLCLQLIRAAVPGVAAGVAARRPSRRKGRAVRSR